MEDESKLRLKLKDAKERLRVKEFENIQIYKELSRYRRANQRLKLKLLGKQAKQSLETWSGEALSISAVSLPVKRPKLETSDLEEGEIGSPKHFQPIKKDLETLLGTKNQVTKNPVSMKEVQQVLSKPSKVAVNTPYTVKNSKDLYAKVQQNIQTIQSVQSPASKFKLDFEVLLKLYKTEYEFNMNSVGVLVDSLKQLEPLKAGEVFLESFTNAINDFSFKDAFEIQFSLLEQTLGNLEWDTQFLGRVVSYMASPVSEEKVYRGRQAKIPSGISIGNSVRENLHACAILLCRKFDYCQLASKALLKLLGIGQVSLMKLSFEFWPELSGKLFSTNLCCMVAELNTDEVSKKLALKASQADSDNFGDLYRTCKAFMRYLGSKESYNFYRKFLWPCLVSSQKDSYARTLVLRVIGVVVQQLQKTRETFQVVQELTQCLEEVISDDKFEGFSIKEQKAAFNGLKKAGHKSKATQSFAKKFNLV